MQISFDKEPVKGTKLEKLLPALLSVKKGGRGRAAAVHFDGVRIGADVGIKCRSYYTHSQPGCDSNGEGGEGWGGWLVYGHANWLVQRQHNHITFYTRRWATKNATAAASLLYFRGNQIATNSIGRTRLSAV